MNLQTKLKQKMIRDVHSIFIESQLKSTDYLVKDGHIITLADKNGMLAVSFESLDTFIEELQEIREIYGG